MNGAQALMKTLSDSGVEVCFANPGTSEMQLVAALDEQHGIRAVLGLFEGVVTGAADGYGRMSDKPAATLLHLGPGLANGLANLHNARRALSPIVNIVGDHAVDHIALDAPLTSDIVGVATPMSDWVATSTSASNLAETGAEAVAIACRYPGQIATMIAPGDHAWTDGAVPAAPATPPKVPRVSDEEIEAAAELLRKPGQSALFIGNRALREEALFQAGRVAAATNARLISDTSPARLQRGLGRVAVQRIPYFAESAVDFMKGIEQLVFIGTKPPVSFFAYPNRPSVLSPEGATIMRLADERLDAEDALRRLADTLNAPDNPIHLQTSEELPTVEDGVLDQRSLGIITAQLLPANAIVSDEGVSSGGQVYRYSAGAPKHDWMTITGGAIGQGLPLATGAAIACPDRKVIAIQADGSAMYTAQALWTMARENLDVTVVILKNNSYGILNIELDRVGVTAPGPKALSLLDLSNPVIDWVAMSHSMGVPAHSASTTQEFRTALSAAVAHDGPRLVEAVLA